MVSLHWIRQFHPCWALRVKVPFGNKTTCPLESLFFLMFRSFTDVYRFRRCPFRRGLEVDAGLGKRCAPLRSRREWRGAFELKNSESRCFFSFSIFIYFFHSILVGTKQLAKRFGLVGGCIAAVQEGEGFEAPSGKGRGEGKKLRFHLWVSLFVSLSWSDFHFHNPLTIP